MQKSESTTLRVVIIHDGGEKTFYRIDAAVDYIEERNLLIRKIDTDEGVILVEADAPGPGLVLRKLEKSDFDNAFELIRECAHEFRPQLCWRGRTIEDMTLNGLVIGKWQGYAYVKDGGICRQQGEGGRRSHSGNRGDEKGVPRAGAGSRTSVLPQADVCVIGHEFGNL